MSDSAIPAPIVPAVAATQPHSMSFSVLIGRVLRSYVFRTILQALFTIWLTVTFTFVLVRLLPSSPVDVYVDKQMQTKGMTYEQALAKASLMFDTDFQKPIGEQYLIYLGNILSGNLGYSITSVGTPTYQVIAQFLPWTLFSVGLALLISFVVGLLMGMIMAYWRNSIFDTVLTTLASFLGSVPNYLIAILIVYLFGVQLKWFSVGAARGAYSPGVEAGFSVIFILDILAHAALPILTYLLSSFGNWALTMKNSTLGVLGEEYVNAAHARGLGRGRIITAYVGRNAALPLFTQLALSIGFVVGGSVIIEQYFQYPGIGLRLVGAIRERDYPIIQGIFLIITITVIIANLLTDFLYGQLDPRVRITKS